MLCAALPVFLLLNACSGDSSASNDSDPAPTQANFAPVARISASTTDGFASLTVNFSGTGSTDSDGSISSYRNLSVFTKKIFDIFC